MNKIFLVRHGNTFDPGDEVVRVGLKTDMPLSSSGILQAEHVGRYIKENRIHFAAAFTSTLQRTYETASVALEEANLSPPLQKLHIFDEIDYGPDEGKTEEEVIARVGTQAIHDWNSMAVVPPGWLVDPEKIVESWKSFAQDIRTNYPDQTVMVVTSNGIARFAPYLTNDFLGFSEKHNIKLGTGNIATLRFTGDVWTVDFWNEKP